MTADLPAARRLSGDFTEACAFDRPGNLLDLVNAARSRVQHDDETIALALVLYAQEAAHSGQNEEDRAALEVAHVLDEWLFDKRVEGDAAAD